MKVYSYTSTPPMGRTACTEPHCLYKGDLYLYLLRRLLNLASVFCHAGGNVCMKYCITYGHIFLIIVLKIIVVI